MEYGCTYMMNIRDTASKTAKWTLIGLGLCLLFEGVVELYSQFGPVAWPLILVSVTIIVSALLSPTRQEGGQQSRRWKVVVRNLFAVVTLVGFCVGGWFAAAIMGLSHESDIPGSLHYRIGDWDGFVVFIIFVLIGITGAARTLLVKRLQVISWSLFLLAGSIFKLLQFS